jgi:hypothetical protein
MVVTLLAIVVADEALDVSRADATMVSDIIKRRL